MFTSFLRPFLPRFLGILAIQNSRSIGTHNSRYQRIINRKNCFDKISRRRLTPIFCFLLVIKTHNKTTFFLIQKMFNLKYSLCFIFVALLHAVVDSFAINHLSSNRQSTSLAADVQKAVKDVKGADLEVMMQEWDQPLVLDAFATVSASKML